MKDGMRFVDCDMHVMEPADLFDRYLDPKFQHRVISAPGRAGGTQMVIDGLSRSGDDDLQQYRKRNRAASSNQRQPLSGSRSAPYLGFAIERGYDPVAQVMGMEMEGVDVAVLFPTMGLGLIARDGMDPFLSEALCRAYNDWIHDFCQHSPDRLKFAAMLPFHDVTLACRELRRCVTELGAVGSFIRPNLVNGRYWHSNLLGPALQPARGAQRNVGLP